MLLHLRLVLHLALIFITFAVGITLAVVITFSGDTPSTSVRRIRHANPHFLLKTAL